MIQLHISVYIYIYIYIYTHTHTHTHFLILFSIMVYHRVLNIVLPAIQLDLVVYSVYKSLHVGVINLHTWRWGDYAGLSGWTQCNSKCPYKREAGELGSEEMWGSKLKTDQCTLEPGTSWREPAASQSWRRRRSNFPRSPRNRAAQLIP